jgi:putative endonuclease
VNAKSYVVYILASRKNGTLYTGMTNNLPRRIYQHRTSGAETFTGKYAVHNLLYAQQFSNVLEAIIWEKRLKRFTRAMKLKLIEESNPEWKDLLFLDSALRAE